MSMCDYISRRKDQLKFVVWINQIFCHLIHMTVIMMVNYTMKIY